MMGWRKHAAAAAAFVCAWCAAPDRAQAGKLDSVRSEVRGDSDSSSSSSSSSSSGSSSSSSSDSSWWDDDDDNDSDSSDGVLDFDFDWGEPPSYLRFPYADGQLGYVHRSSELPGTAERPPSKNFSGSAHVEGAYLYDKVYRSAFGIDLNYWRFGVGSDLSFLLEGPFKDALYLGSSNAKFALIMRPFMRLRVGGGAQYMIDGRVPGEGRREYAAGGNFTSDVDIFPFWPVVISGRFDYGMLYKATSMLGRGTVGLIYNRFELYGGYEARKIGSVLLHGPTAGLRAWF